MEEIGLRATRIRTLERSIITVANAEFANLHLDNYSARDRFWYHPTLQLRYETTPDQIRYILVEVRKMLYSHPKVLPEPLHVRFKSFGQYSLDVEVFAYIGVLDYGESLEVAEDQSENHGYRDRCRIGFCISIRGAVLIARETAR